MSKKERLECFLKGIEAERNYSRLLDLLYRIDRDGVIPDTAKQQEDMYNEINDMAKAYTSTVKEAMKEDCLQFSPELRNLFDKTFAEFTSELNKLTAQADIEDFYDVLRNIPYTSVYRKIEEIFTRVKSD